MERLTQERETRQDKKATWSSRALRKKEWPSDKERRYEQACERYHPDHQKVNWKDCKGITRCKLHMQARDAKEINVLEAKAPSILETWLNSKEESEDEHGKLEDIPEEEIPDAQPRSAHEVPDSEETEEEEDDEDEDDLSEKRTYWIIMKMENELLRIKESHRRIQQKIALKRRNIGLLTYPKHPEVIRLYCARVQ